jgi:beta-lactamase regulating signal transducer with metallopeptidase domain
MINYLITSIILSAIGGITYMLFVKRQTRPLHRKLFVYTVIISSLGLPAFTADADQVQQEVIDVSHAALPFGSQWNVDEIQLQHYCNCENPNFAHRVTYRSNTLYNFFVVHKSKFILAILIAMGLVLIRVMLQYIYLFRLMKRSRQEERMFEGKTYTVLHPPKPHSIGAFQLDKAYIIWQDELNTLSEAEVNAIIQHELSHLKQYNTVEKALLNLIQCWWLLNPVLYYFKRELDLISELIADQQGVEALGSRKGYAMLLLRLKELQAVPVISHFLGANDLKSRIEYVLKSPSAYTGKPLLAMAVVLGLQLTLVNSLSAKVVDTLQQFETYEEIYLNHPEEEECYYCTDCHTVCFPGDE